MALEERERHADNRDAELDQREQRLHDREHRADLRQLDLDDQHRWLDGRAANQVEVDEAPRS